MRDIGDAYNSARSAKKVDEFFLEKLPQKLALLEKSLPEQSSGQHFLVGARLSYADLALFCLLCMKGGVVEWDPFFGNPDASRAAFKDCPRIRKALEVVEAMPTVETFVRNQPVTPTDR